MLQSSDIGRVVVPFLMAAALSLGAFLLQRHWRRKKRTGAARPQEVPDYAGLVERISLRPEGADSSLLEGRTVIASSL